jgi:hypothetical protein
MSQVWQIAFFGLVWSVLCVLLGYWLVNKHRDAARREAQRTTEEKAKAESAEADQRRRRSVEESVRGEGRRLEIRAAGLRAALPGTPEGKLPAGPNSTPLSVVIDGSPLLVGERREETALLDAGMRERLGRLATAWAEYNMHIKTLRTSEAAGIWIEEKTLALLDHLKKSAGELKR